MDRYRIIEVKQSVFADNDAEAASLRAELRAQGTYLINLMSSPGSGKTTTLLRLLPLLQRTLRVGVMEADIDSDVDADTARVCSSLVRRDWISSFWRMSAILSVRRNLTPAHI